MAICVVLPSGATVFLAMMTQAGSVLICSMIWLAALSGLTIWFDRAILDRVRRAASRADAISRGLAGELPEKSSIDEFAQLNASLTRTDRGLRASIRLLDAG